MGRFNVRPGENGDGDWLVWDNAVSGHRGTVADRRLLLQGRVRERHPRPGLDPPEEQPPQILVVAYGDEPTFEQISAAIWGGNRSVAAPTRANLRVCRHGIAAASNCSTWMRWEGAGLGDVA
ncbi:hypothetical protein EV137_1804 [Kribbella pratensis]|uniref:Uncharacterized protein n=1 Tax=Kribbella pratensis TaxID=2512112 RepID=A0ABY2FNI2_9ACTN|nr:hypothetical protein EV137_1804 [Kribbella pratensis]